MFGVEARDFGVSDFKNPQDMGVVGSNCSKNEEPQRLF
jgi:hypothetical protein